MITERAIINALIIAAGFILVPFIISSTLTSDYAPALFFGGLTALVLAFFLFKERLSVMPLLGAAISGALNFLPLPLTATDIFVIMLICYYLTGYVIIRQKRMKVGKTIFLWPILIIVGILLVHNHELNIKALGGGGETEGGKPAYLIYLIVLGYFCGINTTRPSVDFLSKIPFWFFVLTGLSSIPYLLSTYFPALAPYFYSVTSSVNVNAYVDTLDGVNAESQGIIGRLAVFGPMGAALQLYLLSHYPIGTWVRPERWWIAGLSLICTGLAITSGYRSVLFDFAMMTMIGAWCYYSWRALFIPGAICIAGLVVVILSSNNLIHLPLNKLPNIAQRSLSFLPGDWDPDAVSSAESSNFFRKNVQDVYVKEYMMKSPLIGHGFVINTKDFEYYNDALKAGGGSAENNAYLEAKVFIEGKLFHTGWISVYDIVGIVGSIAFIAFGWNEICLLYHFLFGPRADRRSTLYPLYVWLFCNIVTMMVSFFTVFGDFGQTFMDMCCYAIVLSHLSDLENTREIPVPLDERKSSYQPGDAKAALYGYQSR